MASQELAKFEALLQNPVAIKEFKSLFNRCRHLTRAKNMAVTDGELMTVCAYLTGREYAGSAATKEACARLGCITAKTFNRVHEGVSNLLQKSSMAAASKTPTIYSLGQKYGFNEEELRATLEVETVLKDKIPKELQDERIVCAAFAVICHHLGHDSSEWIQKEVELYELDPSDTETVIERVTTVHGDLLRTVIEISRTPGRSSRHRQVHRASIQPTVVVKGLAPPPLKRKASGEATRNQGSIKRAKLHPGSAPSASSTPRSASSSATRESPPATVLSTLDWMSTLDTTENGAAWKASNHSEESVEPRESMQSESEDEDTDDLTQLDWESLARRRTHAIAQTRKQSSSVSYPVLKPVFADRRFWQKT